MTNPKPQESVSDSSRGKCQRCDGMGSYYLEGAPRCIECPRCHGSGLEPSPVGGCRVRCCLNGFFGDGHECLKKPSVSDSSREKCSPEESRIVHPIQCPLGNHLVFVWPDSGKIVPHYAANGGKCPASYSVHPNVTTKPAPAAPSSELRERAREFEPIWRERAFKVWPGLTIAEARIQCAADFAAGVLQEAEGKIAELERHHKMCESAFKLQDAVSIPGRAGEMNCLQISKAWLALEKRAEAAEKERDEARAELAKYTENRLVGTCVDCGASIWFREARIQDETGVYHPLCRAVKVAKADELKRCAEVVRCFSGDRICEAIASALESTPDPEERRAK